MANRASDWYFESLPEKTKDPETLPDGSTANVFIKSDKSIGVRTMITIPMIGWTPKDRVKTCGFSVKKYGEQQEVDKWTPDCGNGYGKDGKLITGNDPLDTSAPINASFAKEWTQYLVKKFGTASKNGVLFYEMDNEYELWPFTHRDVRNISVGTDEILKLTEEYAAAVKEVDPTAQILGPVGCGLLGLFYSGKILLKILLSYHN